MEKGQERWWSWDGRWHPKHLTETQEDLGREGSLCRMGSWPPTFSRGSFWESGNWLGPFPGCPTRLLGDLPIFESRVCFHTCLLPTPLPSHPWGRHQSLCPGQREKTQRRHSGKGFLKEKPQLLNVKRGREVKKVGWAGGQLERSGSWWLLSGMTQKEAWQP